MLRKTISRFGMASAGVAVGAIMAISPVFAQGTTPASTSNGSTLLASILAAAEAAGITLNAEQSAAIAELAAEVTTQAPEPADVETEDEDEADDDTAPATAAPAAKVTKHEVEVKVTTAAVVTKSNEESKSGD